MGVGGERQHPGAGFVSLIIERQKTGWLSRIKEIQIGGKKNKHLKRSVLLTSFFQMLLTTHQGKRIVRITSLIIIISRKISNYSPDKQIFSSFF